MNLNPEALQGEYLDVLYAYMISEQRETNPMLCAYLMKLKAENEQLRREMKELEDHYFEPIPEKQLPFRERFPAWDRIVALKAQLLANAPSQGVPRYKLKVQIWDQEDDRNAGHRLKYWPYGRYLPWYFYLQAGGKFCEKFSAEKFQFLKDDSGLWAGPVTRQGGKRGTDQVRDHLAIYNTGELSDDPMRKHLLGLEIADDFHLLGPGRRVKSDKPKSPTHFWLYEGK
jgi:hypothetical protein